VRRLLEICREAAGPAPGRGLARRLAAWLGDDDLSGELRFGTVSATDRGLAVFLSGNVDLLVPDRGTTLTGADSAMWTDRLVDAPDAPMALTLQGATAPADLLDGVSDLREGVVPGVAVVAVAETAVRARPVLPVEPERVDTADPVDPRSGSTGEQRAIDLRPPDVPAPAGTDDRDATEVVVRRIPGGARAAHRRPATPEPPAVPHPPATPRAARPAPARRPAPAAADPKAERAGAEGPPRAEGYLCARGHLNDPRSHFCVLCGIRMNERTGVLVVDERPPLGLLVFDDGATHTVDTGYLLGREGDARVRSGVLRPIALEDRSGAMSRVHAEIRLENWDVMLTDSGSSNGTFVAEPGAVEWSVLSPSRSVRLVPGARVRLGQRTFTFETPSGVR
jgi:hypothetical protein